MEVTSHFEVEKPVQFEVPMLRDYIDYRRYLQDYFEYRKRSEGPTLRSYTYSMFSAAADIKSPNYLKLVIEGQRNLSPEMAVKFGRAMRLSKAQTDEFVLLVEYCQERDPQERMKHLRALAEYRFKSQIQSGTPQAKMVELVTNWLTYVLFHMTDQDGVQFEVERIRELIRGQTHAEEVRRSIEKLLDAGLLVRNSDNGDVGKGRELIDDAQDVPIELIKRLQSELMFLGMESLFIDSPTDREFGSATMALTEEEFQRYKFELRQLRKKWQKDISTNRKTSKGERIYQLNIQLFPITLKTK